MWRESFAFPDAWDFLEDCFECEVLHLSQQVHHLAIVLDGTL